MGVPVKKTASKECCIVGTWGTHQAVFWDRFEDPLPALSPFVIAAAHCDSATISFERGDVQPLVYFLPVIQVQ